MAVHLNQPAEHVPRVLQWIALVSVDKDFLCPTLNFHSHKQRPYHQKVYE